MTRDIIKVVATLAITAACGGCHNTSTTVEDTAVRETVEEAAEHANVSYATSESEREIIRATNDFSFRLFQSVVANSTGKDILISPLGVVYSLELISNGEDVAGCQGFAESCDFGGRFSHELTRFIDFINSIDDLS